MELHPALRSCGFGDVPRNPYQHLRLCGAERHTGLGVNVFWSIYNIAILLLAAAVCIELPQQREHARFAAPKRRPGGQHLHNHRYIAWRCQNRGFSSSMGEERGGRCFAARWRRIASAFPFHRSRPPARFWPGFPYCFRSRNPAAPHADRKTFRGRPSRRDRRYRCGA